MSTGLWIGGAKGGCISNNDFDGFDIAIHVEGGDGLLIENNHLGDGHTGVKAREMKSFTARGNSHGARPVSSGGSRTTVSHQPYRNGMVWMRTELSEAEYRSLYGN